MHMECHLGGSFQKCIGGVVGQNGIAIGRCVFVADGTSGGSKDISWYGNLNKDSSCRVSRSIANR